MARVTRTAGRVVVVEPDNSARYWYSSVASGAALYAARTRFFAATGDHPNSDIGPRVAALMEERNIEPLSIRLFPVTETQIGAPPPAFWTARARRVQKHIDGRDEDRVRAAGREYLDALANYAREAEAAGSAFVEIQNTLLFATVGQKN
jgi:hypothetical protein